MTAAEFIAEEEGFSETPYKDSAGIWTIGFGRVLTFDKTAPMPTERTTKQRELTDHLMPEVEKRKNAVRAMFPEPLVDEPDRLTALTSFAYNLGVEALRRSKLRQYILDYWKAPTMHRALRVAMEWVDWHQITVGGRKQASGGLVDRRRRTVALFFGFEL